MAPVLAGLLALGAAITVACEAENPFVPSEFVEFSTRDLMPGTGAEAMRPGIVEFESTIWRHDLDRAENKGEQLSVIGGLTVLGVGQIFFGLDRGLVGMRVGGLREIIVPFELARGSGLPPNVNLVIEATLSYARPFETDRAPFSATDLQVGTGAAVADGNTVMVNFGGWLYDENRPDNRSVRFDAADGFTFVVGQEEVIPGWERGVVGMRQGGERRLVIPPNLAYGANGRAPLIPPNATIMFDITVTSVR